jgi:hypothetical protein
MHTDSFMNSLIWYLTITYNILGASEWYMQEQTVNWEATFS